MATYPYPNDVNGLYSFPSTVIQDALGCANLVQQAYFEYYLLNSLPSIFGYPAWSDLVTMPPAGYNLLYNIYYDGIEILDPSVVPYYGYVAQLGSGEIYFVLRGTETITEWFDDIVLSNQVPATTFIQNISSAALVHDGFGKIYSDLRYYSPAKTGNPAVQSGNPLTLSQVLTALEGKTTSLIVTGHSLGAALATLLTMDISLNSPGQDSPPLLTAYTLASPTVGDPNFAAAFFEQITEPAQGTLQITNYRIANGWDSVPNLPPGTYDDPFADFGGTTGQYFYQQVAGFCPVDGGLTTDESIAHSLNSYATGLNNLLNPPAAAKSLPSGRRRRSERRAAALPLVAPGAIGGGAAASPQ